MLSIRSRTVSRSRETRASVASASLRACAFSPRVFCSAALASCKVFTLVKTSSNFCSKVLNKSVTTCIPSSNIDCALARCNCQAFLPRWRDQGFPQAGRQVSVPPHGSVIPDGHAQGPLAAQDNHQAAPPGEGGVEEVALQHHI